MSWGALAGTAVSVGGSFLSKSLNKGGGGGEIPQQTDTRPESQVIVNNAFADFIEKYLPKYKPGADFPGEIQDKFKIPLSQYENQGLGFLQQFLDAPDVSKLLETGRKQLQDTVGGNYDPRTSPYYQALREQSQINRQDAVDQTRASLGSRNKFFSNERLREEGNINLRTSNFMDQILGQLFENERGRQLSALPQLLQFDQTITGRPLSKATAATTIGALPRQAQTDDFERAYRDFTRQRNELAQVASLAAGVGNQQPLGFAAYQPQNTAGSNFLNQATSSAISAAIPALLSKFCHVSTEIFGHWNHPKTNAVRRFLVEKAPKWFFDFYGKYGKEFASVLKQDPEFKERLRPHFEMMAYMGGYANGAA